MKGYSQINRRRDEHSKMHEAVAETKQTRAERDEALSLLRELADWADLAYRDVARPDGAEVIADSLAFVERTSRGDES